MRRHNALHTSTTKTNRFSKVFCLSVFYDQTSVESRDAIVVPVSMSVCLSFTEFILLCYYFRSGLHIVTNGQTRVLYDMLGQNDLLVLVWQL